jgi:hypothetical protein
MSINENKMELIPPIGGDVVIPESIEEAAMRMARAIEENLVSYAEGRRNEFSALFISDGKGWSPTHEQPASQSLHTLAFERVFGFGESRIFEDNGVKIISMRIPTSLGVVEKALYLIESENSEGMIGQIKITSQLNPSAEA